MKQPEGKENSQNIRNQLKSMEKKITGKMNVAFGNLAHAFKHKVKHESTTEESDTD